MDHPKQVAILRELMAHIANSTTARTSAVGSNRADVYTSPDRLQLEQQHIFADTPLVAALSCDIPVPETFITQDAAGTPFLLVRGQDGRARAFLNACRHRGTRLVDAERGRSARISCPFHAWTYDLEGKLVGIARRESFGEFDPSTHGLIALPVAEKYGIIWIKARPGPDFDIDDHLSGLGAELDGWRLAEQFALGTTAIPARMNWKLANDTFGETYHFAILHRDTLSAIYHSNITSYETFGRNHRMVFAARSISELDALPESDWRLKPHSTIAYYLFPNTQLLVSRQSISMYRMCPDPERTDRSLVYQSVYLEREPANESDQANRDAVLERLRTVIVGEDFAVAEASQAAFASGLMDEVVYGRNEPALHHYHHAFDETLDEALRVRR
jgi:phenylpropionate dioxygenase-like ring-hydroxylating dioxygenase large terminal subunit